MGTAAALAVILLWMSHLVLLLSSSQVHLTSPMTWLHVLIQGYLYTGLFITAHDSMHGAVSRDRGINRALGAAALTLFAAFSYSKMFPKHMEHHRFSGTAQDPDFSVEHQDPLRWFIRFFLRYVTIPQLLIMALAFNVLNHLVGIPASVLVLYWVLPAFLATFQLFFFGTYLPHRYPHTEKMAPHNARSLGKNHLWAMVSCWFFGYHYEHHEYPRVPWWKLYQKKD